MSSRDIYEKKNAFVMVSETALLITSLSKKKIKRKERRWWQTNLYQKRCGDEIIMDKSQGIDGQCKNVTLMSASDFENLL